MTRIPDNALDREIDALITFSRVQREAIAIATLRRMAAQTGEAFEPEQRREAA